MVVVVASMVNPAISPDQEFANSRLANIYDELVGERHDLSLYVSLVEEFDAASVLDIGCGTGTLLTNFAKNRIDLVGIDPADASLRVAKQKPGGDKVSWILGGSEAIPARPFDLIFMTGNVAQVFLDDSDWQCTLDNVHRGLSSNGKFVFETRIPQAQAWKEWNKEDTLTSTLLNKAGRVDSWCEVVNVSLPFVSFKWTYRFEADGQELTSESTLRFRDRSEIEESLSCAGLNVIEVRDAPDRPGQEMIFITARHRDRGTVR